VFSWWTSGSSSRFLWLPQQVSIRIVLPSSSITHEWTEKVMKLVSGSGLTSSGWSYQPSRRCMSPVVVPGSWLSSGTGLSISCTLWMRMRPSSIGFIALSRRVF
jgi:hypothetical protein